MPFQNLPPSPHVQFPEGHEICGYCRGWSATGIPEDIAIQTSNTAQGPWKCWICEGLGYTETEPPEPPAPPPSFYLEEDQVAWNLANIPDWGTVQGRKDAEVLITALKKVRLAFDLYQIRHPEPPDPWDL